MMQHKLKFSMEYSLLEFKIFLLLNWLLYQAKEPSLPYYLSIAWESSGGLMPLSRLLVWSKMQTASSRIWTQVADSISYNNNRYAIYACEVRVCTWVYVCMYV